jgi:hypothetical protein
MTVAEPRPRILPRQVVTTTDGAELCTDVYLPDTDEARATVLVRTPYGRSVPLLMQLALDLSKSGFCAVLQDCRGRYRSTGAYDLFQEVEDSHGTLAWLAGQPWCDGKVGLVGLSVSTLPNLLVVADPRPGEAEVYAVVDVMGSVDYHRMCYRDGALLHHWTLPWTAMMGSDDGISDWRGIDWNEVYRHRPLVDAVRRTGAGDGLWRRVVANPAFGGFWTRLSAVEALASLTVPVLHVSGWHDFMLDQALLAWERLGRDGDPARHRLVIGPWNHRSLFAETQARAVPEGGLSLHGMLASWFGRGLGDARPAAGGTLDGTPPVLLHLMPDGPWLGVDAFPPREAEVEEWFLEAGTGNRGRLLRGAVPAPGIAGYDYDPADPVPTLGGAVWPFAPGGLKPGPADQSPLHARPDVLLYTSERLDSDLVVVGHLELELWASTTTRDTDFTAKLVDIDPRGIARWVQDGVVRGRFRNGRECEELLDAGVPYRLRISMAGVAHRFRAGHRLGLEVSSSNFPKFDAHPNIAAPLYAAVGSMVARQTIFHGGTTASRLRLPVLPAAAAEALRVELPAGGAAVSGGGA